MPPLAFQKKNFHHDIPATPAIQAAVKRRIATKRPMKTVFGP